MDEDELEDFWRDRDSYTRPKQVYQDLTNHFWYNPNIIIQHYIVLIMVL